MFKKMLIATAFLTASAASQASLISHNGYERDSSSNIVKGGGLEWLKWDVTKGMSINSALSSYASQGWRLASNVEMADLFNGFQFGSNLFWSNENVHRSTLMLWNASEFSPHNAFMDLFGSTYQSSCALPADINCYLAHDPRKFAYALYGSDMNNNGYYNLAYVYDDHTYVQGVGRDLFPQFHEAVLTGDDYSANTSYMEMGVALVRAPSVVPTPGSIGLLALGLVAVGYRRRKA